MKSRWNALNMTHQQVPTRDITVYIFTRSPGLEFFGPFNNFMLQPFTTLWGCSNTFASSFSTLIQASWTQDGASPAIFLRKELNFTGRKGQRMTFRPAFIACSFQKTYLIINRCVWWSYWNLFETYTNWNSTLSAIWQLFRQMKSNLDVLVIIKIILIPFHTMA